MIKVMTLGMADSYNVTGNVSTAQERIHCYIDDQQLLVIMASCR